MKFDKKLKKWNKLSATLKQVRADEMALRKELCVEILADQEMVNGRVTAKTDNDDFESIKAVQALSYSIDKAALNSLWDTLSEVEQSVVKNEPKLDLHAYKKLPQDSAFQEVVVTRLGVPTLEVK